MNGTEENYIHGYTEEEQKRLVTQGLFLEPWVYQKIDFSRERSVLEVGCGVGAQLATLRRRFPHLTLTGVDRSERQIAAAQQLLAADVAAGQIELIVDQGESLGFAADRFDGAFLCWVLEHASDPIGLLRELRRVVKPGGRVYVTEVFNASLFTIPPSPNVHAFWSELNRLQIEMHGDPHVGVRLGHLLHTTGFQAIEVAPVVVQMDSRTQDPAARKRFAGYWDALLLSAVPGLSAAGRVTQTLIDAARAELSAMIDDREAVFHVAAQQARALA